MSTDERKKLLGCLFSFTEGRGSPKGKIRVTMHTELLPVLMYKVVDGCGQLSRCYLFTMYNITEYQRSEI
jgi:hypothetical protein